MTSKTWLWLTVIVGAALGVFYGCIKPGDGVGLDTNGRVVIIDPCSISHSSPACAEKCIANPAADHCADRCEMDSTLHGCKDMCPNEAMPWCKVVPVDSCLLVPAPARCSTQDSCKLNPLLPGCPPVEVDSCDVTAGTVKPVSCLDRQFFADSVQPIIAQYCPKCHSKSPVGTGYSLVKLSLDPADAWDSLVNVKSKEKTTMMRVKPGLPDSSYMYWKITADKPVSMSRMPLATPWVPLSPENVAIIRKWITGKK